MSNQPTITWAQLDAANTIHYAADCDRKSALAARDAAWAWYTAVCDLCEAGQATQAQVDEAYATAKFEDEYFASLYTAQPYPVVGRVTVSESVSA